MALMQGAAMLSLGGLLIFAFELAGTIPRQKLNLATQPVAISGLSAGGEAAAGSESGEETAADVPAASQPS
jgi:hypothetical protein